MSDADLNNWKRLLQSPAAELFRVTMVDPLDAETKEEMEGLYTLREVEQIREKFYAWDNVTDLIVARRANVVIVDKEPDEWPM